MGMTSTSRFFCFGALLYISIFSSALCERKRVELSLNTKRAMQQLSPYFLSITLDPIVLFSQASGGEGVKNGFDLMRAMNMARGLSPAFLRLGGPSTDQGLIRFKVYTEEEDEHGSSLSDSQERSRNSPPRQMTVNGAQLTLLNHFAEDAGLKIILSLGYDLNKQKSKVRKRAKGILEEINHEVGMDSWDLKQALDIIRFADSMEIDFGYQLGYEVNYINGSNGENMKTNSINRPMNSFEDENESDDISESEAAKLGLGLGMDLIRLRTLIDAFPQTRGSYLFSPGICIPSTLSSHSHHLPYPNLKGPAGGIELSTFLRALIEKSKDALTALVWHTSSYSDGSNGQGKAKSDGDIVSLQEKDEALKILGHSVGNKPIWIGEKWGEESNSGSISKNRDFEEALSWAQRLGTAARIGAQVILYSPKPNALQDPNPQYWVSLLHKKLAGVVVLDTHLSGGNGHSTDAHYYAHCTPHSLETHSWMVDNYPPGSVTVFAANPSSQTVEMTVTGFSSINNLNPNNINTGSSSPKIYEYILTEFIQEASNGNTTRGTLMNGKLLKIGESGALPYLTPNIIEINFKDSSRGSVILNKLTAIKNMNILDMKPDILTESRKTMRSIGDSKQHGIILNLPPKSVAFWVLPPDIGVRPCLGEEDDAEWEGLLLEATRNIYSRHARHHNSKSEKTESSKVKRESWAHEEGNRNHRKKREATKTYSIRKDFEQSDNGLESPKLHRSRRQITPITLPKPLLVIPRLGILGSRPPLVKRLAPPAILGLKNDRKLRSLNPLIQKIKNEAITAEERDDWQQKMRLSNQRTKLMTLPKVVSFDVAEEEPSSGEAYAKGTVYLSDEIHSLSGEDHEGYGEESYREPEDRCDYVMMKLEGELEDEDQYKSFSQEIIQQPSEKEETHHFETHWNGHYYNEPGDYFAEFENFTKNLEEENTKEDVEQSRELFEAELTDSEDNIEDVIMMEEYNEEENKGSKQTKEFHMSSGEIEDSSERSEELIYKEEETVEENSNKESEVVENNSFKGSVNKIGVTPKEAISSETSTGTGSAEVVNNETINVMDQNDEDLLEILMEDISIPRKESSYSDEREYENKGRLEDKLITEKESLKALNMAQDTPNKSENENKRNEAEEEEKIIIPMNQDSTQIKEETEELFPNNAHIFTEKNSMLHGDSVAIEEEGDFEAERKPRMKRGNGHASNNSPKSTMIGENDASPPVHPLLQAYKEISSMTLGIRRKREVNVKENTPQGTFSKNLDGGIITSAVKKDETEENTPKVSGANDNAKRNDELAEMTKDIDETGNLDNNENKYEVEENTSMDSIISDGKYSVFKSEPGDLNDSEEEFHRQIRGSTEIKTPADIARILNFTDRMTYNVDPRSQQLQAANDNDPLSTTPSPTDEMAIYFTTIPSILEDQTIVPTATVTIRKNLKIDDQGQIRDRTEGTSDIVATSKEASKYLKKKTKKFRAKSKGVTVPPLPTIPTLSMRSSGMVPTLPTLSPRPVIPIRPRAMAPIVPTGLTLPTIPTLPMRSSGMGPTLPTLSPRPVIPIRPRAMAPTVPTGLTLPTLPALVGRPMVPVRSGAMDSKVPTGPILPTLPAGPVMTMSPRAVEPIGRSGFTMPTLPTRPAMPMRPRAMEPTMPTSLTMPTLPTMPTRPTRPMPILKSFLPRKLTVTTPPTDYDATEMPTVPTSPMIPRRSMNPSVPRAPTIPRLPARSNAPMMPQAPEVPTVPGAPQAPQVPALPAALAGTNPDDMGPANEPVGLPRPSILPIAQKFAQKSATRDRERTERRRAETERRRLVANAAAEGRRRALENIAQGLSRSPRNAETMDSAALRERTSEIMQHLSETVAVPMQHIWEDVKSRISDLRNTLRRKRDLRRTDSTKNDKRSEDKGKEYFEIKGKVNKRSGEIVKSESDVETVQGTNSRGKRDIFGLMYDDSPGSDHHRVPRTSEGRIRRRERSVQSERHLKDPTLKARSDSLWKAASGEDWPVDREFMYYPSDGFDEYTEILKEGEYHDEEGEEDFWSKSMHDPSTDDSYFAIDTARRGLYPIGPYGVINHLYAQGELYKLEDLMGESQEHQTLSHERFSEYNAGKERTKNKEDFKDHDRNDKTSSESISDKTSPEGIKSENKKEKPQKMNIGKAESKKTRRKRWTNDLREKVDNDQDPIEWAMSGLPVDYGIEPMPEGNGLRSNKIMKYDTELSDDAGNVYFVSLQEKEGSGGSREVLKSFYGGNKQKANVNDFGEVSLVENEVSDVSGVQRIPPRASEGKEVGEEDGTSPGDNSSSEEHETDEETTNAFMTFITNNIVGLINFLRSMMGWSPFGPNE